VLVRALRIHRELNLNLKIIANELALARVYTGKGDITAARPLLDEARALASKDNNRSDLAKVAHQEALLVIREGGDPVSLFEEAIQLYSELGRQRDADRARADLETHLSTIAEQSAEHVQEEVAERLSPSS
jgi:hypothetical protein